jgi:hypothetical protein
MTIDELHLARWNLIRQDIDYHAEFGIPTFWRQHPELGSPIDQEQDLGDGVTAQAFSGGVVRWHPDTGAEIVSE